MLATSSFALASPPAPTRLELKASLFPGFAGARTSTVVATNIHKWVSHYEKSKAEELFEEEDLKAYGFEEGVSEAFTLISTATKYEEAEYEVEVFSSPGGAKHEVAQWSVEEAARYEGRAAVKVASVPGVADSILFSSFLPRSKFSLTDASFSVGRCWFRDGVSKIKTEHASTRSQSEHATVAAAQTISKRMRNICA